MGYSERVTYYDITQRHKLLIKDRRRTILTLSFHPEGAFMVEDREIIEQGEYRPFKFNGFFIGIYNYGSRGFGQRQHLRIEHNSLIAILREATQVPSLSPG